MNAKEFAHLLAKHINYTGDAVEAIAQKDVNG